MNRVSCYRDGVAHATGNRALMDETHELRESVAVAARRLAAGALMANHGAIAYGHDLDAAVANALLLEWACGVYWHAKAIGGPRAMDDAQSQAVIDAAVSRGYGDTHERRG